MQLMDEATIARRLGEVPEWSRNSDQINRTVKAPNFLAGIRIVDDVAQAAERANHHPDIDIRYDQITFTLTTHDAGGLTDRDFDLARTINAIAASHAST